MFRLAHAYFRKVVVLLLVTASGNTYAQRPHIIYIMSDDMGYGDLSCYGNKDYPTPNLDKLASQGIKFVNAYSAAPVCTPTRTAFMTGRYPGRTPVGLKEPLTKSKKDSAVGLTQAYPSVASLLKAANYETALIGKWHLGFRPEHNPTKNGFDYFFGILAGAADYTAHKSGPPGQRAHDLYENDTPVYPEGYLTNLFTQKAAAFIRKPHDKPFFLAIMFNAPHWPWQGPSDKAYADTVDFTKNGSRSTYATMVKRLDEEIGELMKSLDAAHLSEQTLVIFTNDNGGERFSDNGGLSEGKMTLWEGGIRVPAFVRWPGQIKAGTVTQQAAITMDWTATILSAGGAKAPAAFPLDGIDLMPVCRGVQKTVDRTFYWKQFHGNKQQAIKDGHWKYLQDQQGEYLFDLANDQPEKNDLKERHQAIFARLKRKYADWEKTLLVAD
ncbi:twin-arginine translocation pathway signal protein [Nostoc linckia z16]|nr:twin-arginine translocation pathway signal protein [Nostoc linckia z16]